MTDTDEATEKPRGDIDQRRRDVLEAAAEVLNERAWGGFSMREVAQRAGVSAGAVYQWFSGKDEIFSVLHNVRFEEELERLEALPDDIGFEELVGDVLRSMAELWADVGHHRTAFLADRDPERQDTFAGNLAESFRALTAGVERSFGAAAAREGRELRDSAEWIPWFWAMCIGTGTQLVYERAGGMLTPDDFVTNAIAPTAAGLLAP